MDSQALLAHLATRASLVLLDPLDPLVHVAPLVSEERLELQDLLALPVPLVPMVSLALRVRLETTDPRETPVSLALLDPPELPDLRVPSVLQELKELVVLQVLLVQLVSLVLLAESDLQAPLVTVAPLAPQGLVERTDRRVTVVTPALLVALVRWDLLELQGLLERRVRPVVTVLLALQVFPDPRVLLDLVVLWVCPDREASAVSPVSLAHLESQANRDLVAPAESVAPLDPWDPLDWLVPLVNPDVREPPARRDRLDVTDPPDPKETAVRRALLGLPVHLDPPELPVLLALLARMATAERWALLVPLVLPALLVPVAPAVLLALVETRESLVRLERGV